MRRLLLTTLMLATAGCAGGHDRSAFRQGSPSRGPGTGEGGGPRGRLFISPMGEPFRAEPDKGAPQELWFAGADANHDGTLTVAEFEADAARFFAVLDQRKDGEIDPDDIEYYETVLAPEIRVGGAAAGRGTGAREGGRRGGGGGRRGNGGGGGRRGGGMGDVQGGEGGSTGANRPARTNYGRQGAARFSYLEYPEPVTVADRNFNRGVDPVEFQRAAAERFVTLDRNSDGKIPRGELPDLARESGRADGPRGLRGRAGAAPD